MPSRDLKDLDPAMRPLAKELLDRAHEVLAPGKEARSIMTLRSTAEHFAFRLQGRDTLENVNKARKAAGLPALTLESQNVVVTWTKKSRHLPNDAGFSEAMDVGIFDTATGKYLGNDTASYKALGPLGESIGLEWGGRFKDDQGRSRPDYPHYQLKR